MLNMRVITTGLEFPEGPIVMKDGSVILVEIMGERLTRVYPDGRKETVAKIPGGPNGAAMGPDGKIKPHVSQHFPLARGADAIAALQQRKALGKVVVVM